MEIPGITPESTPEWTSSSDGFVGSLPSAACEQAVEG